MADDRLTAWIAAARERTEAATPGPWWSDQDERVYRLHGVHATIPAQMFPGSDEVMIPEQVMNHQILKAPKQGTSYAEYWPAEADDAFITHARTDVPRLLAAVEAALGVARKLEPQAPSPSVLEEDRMFVRQQCADMIREAITRELLGEDGSSEA